MAWDPSRVCPELASLALGQGSKSASFLKVIRRLPDKEGGPQARNLQKTLRKAPVVPDMHGHCMHPRYSFRKIKERFSGWRGVTNPH